MWIVFGTIALRLLFRRLVFSFLHLSLLAIQPIKELLGMGTHLRGSASRYHLLNHLPVLAVGHQPYMKMVIPSMNFSCYSLVHRPV